MTGRRRPGVAGVSPLRGRQLRSRPSDESPMDAATAAHSGPGTAAGGPRRNVPNAARHELVATRQHRARYVGRRAKVTVTGTGSLGRGDHLALRLDTNDSAAE